MSDYSEILKVSQLLSGKIRPAPVKKQLHGKWHEATIGIGQDHSAIILIDDEAYQELQKIIAGESSTFDRWREGLEE